MKEVIKGWECLSCEAVIEGKERPSKCLCGKSRFKVKMVKGDLSEEELKKILEEEKLGDFKKILAESLDKRELAKKVLEKQKEETFSLLPSFWALLQ